MPSISGSLTGKMSPAERASKALRVEAREKKEREAHDVASANSLFDEIWMDEIFEQRQFFKDNGKFKKTKFSVPSGDKFHFKYSYSGVEVDLFWEVEWDRKKAKATKKSWTNP